MIFCLPKTAWPPTLERMTHLEVWGDGSMTLFDYRDRDPLDGNARCIPLCAQEVEDD